MIHQCYPVSYVTVLSCSLWRVLVEQSLWRCRLLDIVQPIEWAVQCCTAGQPPVPQLLFPGRDLCRHKMWPPVSYKYACFPHSRSSWLGLLPLQRICSRVSVQYISIQGYLRTRPMPIEAVSPELHTYVLMWRTPRPCSSVPWVLLMSMQSSQLQPRYLTIRTWSSVRFWSMIP